MYGINIIHLNTANAGSVQLPACSRMECVFGRHVMKCIPVTQHLMTRAIATRDMGKLPCVKQRQRRQQLFYAIVILLPAPQQFDVHVHSIV